MNPFFQLSRIKRKSPAWTLFLPLSRQACKIFRISGEKTSENNYLANFHRQGGMQPQKIIMITIYLSILIKKNVKSSIL